MRVLLLFLLLGQIKGAADPSLEKLVPGPFYEWWDAIEPQQPNTSSSSPSAAPAPLRSTAVAASPAATGALGAADQKESPPSAGDPSSISELTKKAVQYEGLTESLALVAETINKQVCEAGLLVYV